jgi:tRNA(fMet)-specific endonuclease VapC
MILLDSDHLSVLKFRSSPRSLRLADRLALDVANGPIGTTVVNVEETMRGWLASIAKERQIARQGFAYRELAELFTFFSGMHIALFDASAIGTFTLLKAARIRISTMDLKIAAIAIAHNALLLTANRRDFELIPGLRFENWLEEQPPTSASPETS